MRTQYSVGQAPLYSLTSGTGMLQGKVIFDFGIIHVQCWLKSAQKNTTVIR